MEGHTQGHLKRNKEDVLFRIPKTSYFRTRYKEISVIIAHSSEIETKKSLILKEKRLDLLGRLIFMMNKERLKRVITEMKKLGLKQILVSDDPSIFWLTGRIVNPM